MDVGKIVAVALTLGAAGLVMMLVQQSFGRSSRLDSRLRGLEGKATAERGAVRKLASEALPKVGTHLVPGNEAERSKLQARLVQAGFYGRQAMPLFLGVKSM